MVSHIPDVRLESVMTFHEEHPSQKRATDQTTKCAQTSAHLFTACQLQQRKQWALSFLPIGLLQTLNAEQAAGMAGGRTISRVIAPGQQLKNDPCFPWKVRLGSNPDP